MKCIIYFLFTCLTISAEYRADFPYPYQLTQVGGRSVNKAERYQAKQLYKKLNNAVKKYKIDHDILDGKEDFSGVKDLKREFLKKYSRKRFSSISTSFSDRDFKDEFRETIWVDKQFEALNKTLPKGDVVNMIAARPHGVYCGDSDQHDMPWGTCVLGLECEPEYRIYRGDLACGRTDLVCCSVVSELYDINIPFELSFESSGFDSLPVSHRGDVLKKGQKERKKRKKDRLNRKKVLRYRIESIIRQIHKMLLVSYKNASKIKKRRTKKLKLFIMELKRQAKKDRMAVRDVHEVEMIRIDSRLRKAIAALTDVNDNFFNNGTLRNIIYNIDGNDMITKKTALMLKQYYPQLRQYFPAFRANEEELGNLTYDLELYQDKFY